MKRFFDFSIALVLTILFLPIFVIIAILIKLDSRGPIFFKQERLGQFKRPFKLLKFRSMFVSPADSGLLITPAGDKRITPIGQILRRTKLDELPQLINVLRGEMSLVGPRPEVARYVYLYPEAFEAILAHKPGVTDLATLDYIDESDILGTSSDPEHLYITDILPKKLQRSQQYIDSASFTGDLRIIVQTLRLLGRSVFLGKK